MYYSRLVFELYLLSISAVLLVGLGGVNVEDKYHKVYGTSAVVGTYNICVVW